MGHNPTGIPWLTEEEYGQLLTLLGESRENLSESYASLRKQLEARFQSLQSNGVPVYKIETNVADFIAWCQENGLEVNRNAWDSFITHKTRFLHAHTSEGGAS